MVAACIAIGCGGRAGQEQEATPATSVAPPPKASTSSSPPPPRAPEAEKLSADAAGKQFFEAMFMKNRAGLQQLTLSYDELSSISNRAPPREQYEDDVARFLDSLIREASEADAPVEVVGVKVESEETLLASENGKLKRDLPVARVRPILRIQGKTRTGLGFLFVDAGSGFRLSIRN